MMIEIRAKSTLKITTGKSNVDYNYRKGTPISSIAGDILHALIHEHGTKEAKKIIKQTVDTHSANYKGLGK